jgi:hypothetical protein
MDVDSGYPEQHSGTFVGHDVTYANLHQLLCAICVRDNPVMVNCGDHRYAQTQVGPLAVCGHHVEEALRLVLAYQPD